MALGCYTCGLLLLSPEVPCAAHTGLLIRNDLHAFAPDNDAERIKILLHVTALHSNDGWCASGVQAPRRSSAPRCMRSWSHGCCRMAYSWSSWVALHLQARRVGQRGVPHQAPGPRGGLWLTLPVWQQPRLCGCLDR